MKTRRCRALRAAVVISAAIAAYGCGDHDTYHRHDIPAGGVVVNLGSQALTFSQVQAIAGTYGEGCGQPIGTAEWSVTVNGAPAGLPPALQVNEGSTDCQLVLTRVAGLVDGAAVMFTASPGLVLGGSFLGDSVRFTGENGVSFYSNARLAWSGTPWDSNLTVEFLFSDDPEFDPIGGAVTPRTIVIAAPILTGVPSPDYEFSVGTLSVIPTVPARVAGSSSLGLKSQAGTEHKIVVRPAAVAGTPTFADIDAAYGAAAGAALPQNLGFAGSAFEAATSGLATSGLAVVWLIIANVQEGVRAYQAIEITFRDEVAPAAGLATGRPLEAAMAPAAATRNP